MKCIQCDGEVVGRGVSYGKFCCGKCKYTWDNHHRTLAPNTRYNCIVCGNTVVKYVSPSRKGVNETMQFCSRACKGKHQTGERHPRWKGKQVDRAGYVYKHAKSHPYCNKDGLVFEHRLVMEAHIGRILDPSEVVHHINDNPSDNRINNLMLFTNNGSHKKHHEQRRTRCSSTGRYQSLSEKIQHG